MRGLSAPQLVTLLVLVLIVWWFFNRSGRDGFRP